MTKTLSRRNFLKSAALAGAGLTLAACSQGSATQQPSGGQQPAAPTAQVQNQGTQPVTIQWMVWGGPERYQPLVDAYKTDFPDMSKWLSVELVSPGSGENDFTRLCGWL